ncbi:hypothetical protein F4825DRAFT_469610 [Nemania diffusa]|nr:hypothetical protein F4825DRAFT_469610 [Nemania diffusa]
MSSRKVPLTFTFHRNGVHPPIFVAGTFSNPPWKLLAMDASIDQHGDFIFTKQVMVDECSEIQYKFRHASGDWWALDPDADTVTDVNGNVNSLMYSPNQHAAQETTLVQETRATKVEDIAGGEDPDPTIPRDTQAPVTDAYTRSPDTEMADINSPKEVAEEDELRRLSFTPIDEVANTAAEVADSASHLDHDEDEDSDFEVDSGDMLPMLSHECFASTAHSQAPSHQVPGSQHENFDPCSESIGPSTTDYDDPRLEAFPSDRDSIIATMRRLSTAIDVDPTMVDITPLSAVTTTSKPPAAGSPSPTRGSFGADDTNAGNRRAGDAAHKPASTASAHSLQSIAEGEEAPDSNGNEPPLCDEAEDTATPTSYIGPLETRNLSLASAASSNEDEGISMGGASRKRTSETAALAKAAASDPPPTSFKHTPSIASSSAKSSEPDDDDDDDDDFFGSDEESAAGVQRKPANNNGERPHSPSPVAYPVRRSGDGGNWLGALLRTIFVDWLGGFARWLCGRGRNQV